LAHRDIEWLAREVGYRGARHQDKEPALPQHPDQQASDAQGFGSVVGQELGTRMTEKITGRPQIGYEGQRNMDAVTMKGDAHFRKQLTANGLEYVDHIDNRQTGMQAILVKDKAGDGRVYAIFRGTEPTYEFGKDAIEADVSDWSGGHLAVGKTQYETDKAKLDEWARNHKGNITVTGHSLGAALGQRFIADNPDAVNAAVLFNAPGVEPEVANRTPRDKLPPITYYLHPKDPVSNLGGYQHVYGTVNLVQGAHTDSYIPGYGHYLAHSAWMLQSDKTTKKQVDYDQHQAERNLLLALEKAADKEVRRFTVEMETQLGALRAQIGAAQGRAQGAAVSASNASSAAQNLLAELRRYQSQMQQGPHHCRAAFMKRREIEEGGSKAAKYADGAAKGTKIARDKVLTCASKEEVRAGLVMYDSARKLAREALAEQKRMQQARGEIEAALEEANSARTLLGAAERAGQQIAAELASARLFGKQAREEAERLANLADQLYARKNGLTAQVQQFTASLLPDLSTAKEKTFHDILEQKMRPLLEQINVREPVVANAWADQAENHARRAEDILQQAQAIIAELKGLDFSQCDLVSAGEEAATRTDSGANATAAENIDVELLQKANLCLAKLSPPDALQTSATTNIASTPTKDLLERAKDRLENDKIAGEKERLQKERIKDQERREREEAQKREKARQEQLARQRDEQRAPAEQQAPEQNDFSQATNLLESLVSSIAGGIQQQQIQRQLQRSSQQAPRPQPQTPQVARATPETRSAARAPAAAAPSGPKYFALIASASKPSMLAYQKIPECRFLKHTGPFPISQTKPGEIDKAVSDLRAQGHYGVEARYFSSEQEAERFKDEWDRRVGSDTDKCYDAQFRYTNQRR
jgi:pimeloyl-ACP methyl ester carboxylesterase